jgi:hypothetical protein
MHEANFELIEIPHVRQSGKNSADIRLVVDALDLCYTKSHVNTFVIISGDSDFSPLVSKLRENNKQVIGVGVKNSTSDLLTANCDEFIFYDDLVREGQRANRRAPPPPGPRRGGASDDERRRDENESRRAKGIDLAVQTLEALASERGDSGKIWASVLKEAIKRRKPDFSESFYGFRNFGSLLEEAQSRGLLEVGRDEKANAYVFRSALASQGSPALTALAAESAEGAAPANGRTAEEAPAATEARAETQRGRGPRGRGGRRGAERHEFEASAALAGSEPVPEAAAAPAEPDEVIEREAVVATLRDEPSARNETVEENAAAAPAEARPRRGTRGGGRKKAEPAQTAEATAETPAATEAPQAEVATAKTPRKTAARRPSRPRGAAAKKTAG